MKKSVIQKEHCWADGRDDQRELQWDTWMASGMECLTGQRMDLLMVTKMAPLMAPHWDLTMVSQMGNGWADLMEHRLVSLMVPMSENLREQWMGSLKDRH